MVNKQLKVGLFNAGSLGSNHDDFIVSVMRYDIDVLAINETWLREGEDGRAPELPGYKLRHIPRPREVRSRGGGVGFYVRSNINSNCFPRSVTTVVGHPNRAIQFVTKALATVSADMSTSGIASGHLVNRAPTTSRTTFLGRDSVSGGAQARSLFRAILKGRPQGSWLRLSKSSPQAANLPIVVQCDASKDGIGCCLLQNNKPVCFASHSLTQLHEDAVDRSVTYTYTNCSSFTTKIIINGISRTRRLYIRYSPKYPSSLEYKQLRSSVEDRSLRVPHTLDAGLMPAFWPFPRRTRGCCPKGPTCGGKRRRVISFKPSDEVSRCHGVSDEGVTGPGGCPSRRSRSAI
ncbi:hypothetical protein K1T71_015305 [Dendrolimus kikuchii]|nr:hypothetical protein K1T71_015305 [Dendrolimus kikuchii]